jgi:hypothetical protein
MQKELIPLLAALFSGIFGLAVAITTTWLTTWKDSRHFRRDRARERYERVFILYTEVISDLELAIRVVDEREEDPEIFKRFARQNAMLRLLSNEAINAKSDAVSENFYAWSTEYRQGGPKRLGGTSTYLISSNDSRHEKKAKELFPSLHDSIYELTGLMREHLSELETAAR